MILLLLLLVLLILPVLLILALGAGLGRLLLALATGFQKPLLALLLLLEGTLLGLVLSRAFTGLLVLLLLLVLSLKHGIWGVLGRPLRAVRVDIAWPVFVWMTRRPSPVRLCRGRPVLADTLIRLRPRQRLRRLVWRGLRTGCRSVRLA